MIPQAWLYSFETDEVYWQTYLQPPLSGVQQVTFTREQFLELVPKFCAALQLFAEEIQKRRDGKEDKGDVKKEFDPTKWDKRMDHAGEDLNKEEESKG